MMEKRVKRRHPMIRCPMRSRRLGRRIRRSNARKRSLAPRLSLSQVMIPTPIPREEPHAPPTRAAHQGQKERVIIVEYHMTTHFQSLVNTMHQLTWASHLTLMVPAIINGRRRCLVISMQSTRIFGKLWK